MNEFILHQDLRPVPVGRRTAYPPLESACRSLVAAIIECAIHDARSVAARKVRAHDMRTMAKKRAELVEFFSHDAARLADAAALDIDGENIQRRGLRILGA